MNFNSNYFELKYIKIILYRVLTWRGKKRVLPRGGVWTRHVVSHMYSCMCMAACVRACVSGCAHVCAHVCVCN